MPRPPKKNSKAKKPEVVRNYKSSKAKKPEIVRNYKSSKRTKVCPELLLPKKLIKTPGKKRVKVDLKKIESLESNQGDYILQFIASKTTRDEKHLVTKKIDVHTKALKKIDVHTKALKKLITTSFNFVRNYEFLISSAKEVLRLVDCYIKDSKLQPFNYDVKVFDPPREDYKPPDVSAYTCNLAKNGYASVYPNSWIDPENVLYIDNMEPSPLAKHTLNQKESKIWLEFKKLDKGNFVEEEEERSINLSYPLVGVIGGFAVAAFNKACELIKKVEHNLHDFEYMECKYVKDTEDYLFYMTIEAIEEGNLGVYEAIVVCPRADVVGTSLHLTLLKFVLTDRTPVGAKAMALSLFSCMRSLCKALEDDAEIKGREIALIHNNTRGMTRGKAYYEMVFLGYFEVAVLKGIRRVLYLNLELLFEADCTRRSVPDDWLDWSILDISWLVSRNNGTPCRGYDYDNYNQYLTARSALAKK